MSPSQASESLSQGRQSLIVGALAFSGLAAAFMQTILIPIQGALPDLLNSAPQDTAWVITITLLTAAVSTPIVGKLGDMYGKRRMSLILLAILALGSLVCTLSQGLAPLIVGRGLQGMGMGVIPLGISMLRDLVDPRRLGSSIAIVSATLGVGGAIGLPISALVTQHLEWHMLFVMALAISVIALTLTWSLVPANDTRTGGRVDVIGGVGLAFFLTCLLLGISRGNSWGWTSITTLTCFAVGTGTLFVWALYELRVDNPLVDLRLSVKPAVLMTNLASVCMGFALFSSNISFPQILQLPRAEGGMDMDLLATSLLLMPAGLAMLAVSPFAGRLQRHAGPRPLLLAGAAIIALAYLACVLLPVDTHVIGWVNLVIGVGIGLGYAAMPALIMNAVPREETASANALNTLMRSFGTTVAAAVIGSVLSSAVGSGQAEAFSLVFLLGFAAASACAALAALIPTQGRLAFGG